MLKGTNEKKLQIEKCHQNLQVLLLIICELLTH